VTWGLCVSSHCSKVVGEGIACMICNANPAVGHTRAGGGPFDGRLLLLHCDTCVPPEDDGLVLGRIRLALAELANEGHLDPATGGPGPLGPPEVRHDDHMDPWPQGDL